MFFFCCMLLCLYFVVMLEEQIALLKKRRRTITHSSGTCHHFFASSKRIRALTSQICFWSIDLLMDFHWSGSWNWLDVNSMRNNWINYVQCPIYSFIYFRCSAPFFSLSLKICHFTKNLSLFILAIDRLHKLIEKAASNSLLKQILPRAAKLRCSLYADDVVNPGWVELQHLLQLLNLYGNRSGLRINMSKTETFPWRIFGAKLAPFQGNT